MGMAMEEKMHLRDGRGWHLRFNAWAGFADRCGGPISDIGVRGSGGCPEVGPCHHLACGDRKMVQFIFKFRVSHQKPVFCPKTPNRRCGGVAVPRPFEDRSCARSSWSR